MPASVSSSSRTSPAVMSLTGAALGRDDERGPAQRARRHRAGCRGFLAEPPQLCEPGGVTGPGQARGQSALAALAATSQRSEGRMMSALIAIRSPMPSSPCRQRMYLPRPRSHGRTPAATRARGVGSAAAHRCCQCLPAGLPASPAATAARGCGCPGCWVVQANGGLVSSRHTSSRHARSPASPPPRRARGKPDGPTPTRAPGACPAAPASGQHVVTAPGSRTRQSASRPGNPEPAPARLVLRPAGPARRDGPAPGGSRPPCAASGRSEWSSAGRGPRTNCTSVSGSDGSSAIR